MEKTLHFITPSRENHAAFAALAGKLAACSSELHIANRLWGQKQYTFLDSFLALTR
jgi:hypothetical protein